MTTETAPEATEETVADDPFADAKCSNCGDAVKRRRPSLTGKHFCAKKGCQKAKHRFHHRRRAEGAAESEARLIEDQRKQTANFVSAALHGPRVDCDTCGRPEVVPRYAHPVPDWSAPCNPKDRLPVSGDPLLTTKLMRSVYPS